MGETDRYIEYKKRRISFGDTDNALIALIGINGIIFIILDRASIGKIKDL